EQSRLWVVDVATGEATEVNPRPGKVVSYGSPIFAARGNALYYTSDEDSDFLRLVRHDLDTGKQTVITPTTPWDVGSVRITPDGRTLAWVVNEGGRSALYLAPTQAPARAQRVALPPGVIAGLDFDLQSRRLGLSL